jgi:hypothetical protein
MGGGGELGTAWALGLLRMAGPLARLGCSYAGKGLQPLYTLLPRRLQATCPPGPTMAGTASTLVRQGWKNLLVGVRPELVT